MFSLKITITIIITFLNFISSEEELEEYPAFNSSQRQLEQSKYFGIYEQGLEERIVGGRTICINRAPFQASLQDRLGNHFCGGSLISSSRVLTSAICISKKLYRVRVNTRDIYLGGERLLVLKTHVHPDFDYHSHDYDYAVLEIEPSKYCQKFATLIGEGELVPDGTLLYATGWGQTLSCIKSPNLLRGVELVKINDDDCDQAYNCLITERMVCAGYKTHDVQRVFDNYDSVFCNADSPQFIQSDCGPCVGDRGGPLFVAGTQTLVGIISWGAGCNRPFYPGVYSRVACARKWILSI